MSHRRCVAYPIPKKEGNEVLPYTINEEPTISEVRRGREKGAIILHRITETSGNVVRSAWVTDCGYVLVESIKTV